MTMSPRAPYDADFYESKLQATSRSAATVLGLLYQDYTALSLIDVGCGRGAWLAEAERLEHCLSDRLTAAIAAHLNDPACDPHGDPIPTRDGAMPPGLGQPLSELAVGVSGRIVRVRLQDEAALQYLSQQGLEPGRTVTVIATSPLDGQLSLHVQGPAEHLTIGIGRQAAAAIDVDPI